MSHTSFVPYDPNQEPKRVAAKSGARRIDGHVLCQTCFVSFDTEQALRDHIGAFQLEGQQLMGRMQEVSMHLPPQGDKDDNGDDSGSGSDDEDEDEDENEDKDDDHHKCPFPGCRRRTLFKTKSKLEIHYQKHLQCYETCVFCRHIFIQVRKFLRHRRCKARGQKSKEDKEFYRKERSAQLRAFTAEQLRQKLYDNENRLPQTKKRKHEDQNSSSQTLSKKQATRPDSTFQELQVHSGLQSNGLNSFLSPVVTTGVASQSNIDMTVWPTQTPLPSQTNHYRPQTNLVDMNLYNRHTFSPGQRLNVQGRWAPVFSEDTITPCYNAESQQPAFSFSPNDPNMVYSPQAQAGAYGEDLPTSTQQN